MIETKEQASEFLKSLICEMNTQDNLGTASPYFYVVRRFEWVPAHPEYNRGPLRDVWVDFKHGDPSVYHSKEDYLAWAKDYYGDEFSAEKAEEQFKELTYLQEEHRFVNENVFFTKSGYDQHMAQNSHNYRSGEYQPYIMHAFRNPELGNIFRAIGILVDTPWEKK